MKARAAARDVLPRPPHPFRTAFFSVSLPTSLPRSGREQRGRGTDRRPSWGVKPRTEEKAGQDVFGLAEDQRWVSCSSVTVIARQCAHPTTRRRGKRQSPSLIPPLCFCTALHCPSNISPEGPTCVASLQCPLLTVSFLPQVP